MKYITDIMIVVGALVGVGAILERLLKAGVLQAVSKLILLTADRSNPLLSNYIRTRFTEKRDNIDEVLLTESFITLFLFLVFLLQFIISAGPLFIAGFSLAKHQSVIPSGWLAFWIILALVSSSWSIYWQIKISKEDLTASNVTRWFFKNYFVVAVFYSLIYTLLLTYTIILMAPAWICRIDVATRRRRRNYYAVYAAVLIIVSVILRRFTQ